MPCRRPPQLRVVGLEGAEILEHVALHDAELGQPPVPHRLHVLDRPRALPHVQRQPARCRQRGDVLADREIGAAAAPVTMLPSISCAAPAGSAPAQHDQRRAGQHPPSPRTSAAAVSRLIDPTDVVSASVTQAPRSSSAISAARVVRRSPRRARARCRPPRSPPPATAVPASGLPGAGCRRAPRRPRRPPRARRPAPRPPRSPSAPRQGAAPRPRPRPAVSASRSRSAATCPASDAWLLARGGEARLGRRHLTVQVPQPRLCRLDLAVQRREPPPPGLGLAASSAIAPSAAADAILRRAGGLRRRPRPALPLPPPRGPARRVRGVPASMAPAMVAASSCSARTRASAASRAVAAAATPPRCRRAPSAARPPSSVSTSRRSAAAAARSRPLQAPLGRPWLGDGIVEPPRAAAARASASRTSASSATRFASSSATSACMIAMNSGPEPGSGAILACAAGGARQASRPASASAGPAGPRRPPGLQAQPPTQRSSRPGSGSARSCP